jgi:hypothetical protein
MQPKANRFALIRSRWVGKDRIGRDHRPWVRLPLYQTDLTRIHGRIFGSFQDSRTQQGILGQLQESYQCYRD